MARLAWAGGRLSASDCSRSCKRGVGREQDPPPRIGELVAHLAPVVGVGHALDQAAGDHPVHQRRHRRAG